MIGIGFGGRMGGWAKTEKPALDPPLGSEQHWWGGSRYLDNPAPLPAVCRELRRWLDTQKSWRVWSV